MVGGKCVILNETIDPVFKRPDITFSSPADFETCYANRLIEVPGRRGFSLESIGKVWLEAPIRRQYEGIVFAPGREEKGFYNLYRGLPVKPIKGDWSLMENHIWKVVTNRDEESYRYLKAWMAHIVKNPGGKRPGTSVVLRGKQGVGKGCFASQYGEIFGSHFLHVTNAAHLVNRFNQHLKDALLVFVDEGVWAGNKTAEGVLRGMITEKYFLCEPKGKDAFPVENHVNLIIASNNKWIVPAGLEERRFMVLDVSDKYIQDKDYFTALFNQMDNGGREAMLYDLLEMDISDVDLRIIPRTEALLDQSFHTMSTVAKFWLERLREGSLLDNRGEIWDSQIEIKAFYDSYVEFANARGDRTNLIKELFGKEIRELCPGTRSPRPTINGRRTRVYTFPDLQTCRKRFEERVKMKINWDDDGGGDGGGGVQVSL